ncbi:hypothetical protein [Archaeoglobus neptunius]|uniref:hypothetical protein n=1 Tax=Archaeoglobus neptunius TaxID=2798580 RepID=UPI00192603DF|nr:hypothetical protein [Archaeoglobus neptunius]
MIKSYLLKIGDEFRKHGEGADKFREILSELDKLGIRNAVILLNSNALYFEKNNVAAIVEVSRGNLGAAKIFIKKIARESKKINLSTIEDAFKFAEELEKADLNGIAKFLR